VPAGVGWCEGDHARVNVELCSARSRRMRHCVSSTTRQKSRHSEPVIVVRSSSAAHGSTKTCASETTAPAASAWFGWCRKTPY